MNWVERVYPDEPVGTAVCASCGERKTVYASPIGLVCADCNTSFDTYDALPDTYEPSLREPDTSQDEELAENIEAFDEQLLDIGFDVEMQDGSTWEMDKHDAHAVLMKYGDQWQQYLPALATTVAEHYDNQTEPTRFGGKTAWGRSEHDDSQDSYDTHAELAPVVAYADLRGAKMQLGFMALSGPDNDDDPVNVIGLGDDEVHQYTPNGRVTIEFDPDAEFDFDENNDDEGDQQ